MNLRMEKYVEVLELFFLELQTASTEPEEMM